MNLHHTHRAHIRHKTHCENPYCQQEQKLIATVIYIREQKADNLKHQNVSAIYIAFTEKEDPADAKVAMEHTIANIEAEAPNPGLELNPTELEDETSTKKESHDENCQTVAKPWQDTRDGCRKN